MSFLRSDLDLPQAGAAPAPPPPHSPQLLSGPGALGAAASHPGPLNLNGLRVQLLSHRGHVAPTAACDAQTGAWAPLPRAERPVPAGSVCGCRGRVRDLNSYTVHFAFLGPSVSPSGGRRAPEPTDGGPSARELVPDAASAATRRAGWRRGAPRGMAPSPRPAVAPRARRSVHRHLAVRFSDDAFCGADSCLSKRPRPPHPPEVTVLSQCGPGTVF